MRLIEVVSSSLVNGVARIVSKAEEGERRSIVAVIGANKFGKEISCEQARRSPRETGELTQSPVSVHCARKRNEDAPTLLRILNKDVEVC